MKLIIAGGRDYHLTEHDLARLDGIEGVEEVISGGASGADAGGEQWARSHGIPVTVMRADWDDLTHPRAVIKTRRDGSRYNAAAGPIRNEKMASIADALAVFPGGSGTADMVAQAKKRGLVIFDFR